MKRLAYIDGLKGVCALWVCFFHYILAFYPYGFIGWGSDVPPEKALYVYYNAFPFSVLSNASYPLYIFFALISFIPTYNFFQTRKSVFFHHQIYKRYFRLMPPVLACTLIGYFLWQANWNYNLQLAPLTNSSWVLALIPGNLSLTDALKSGLFMAFINGDGRYNSVLWCMNIILIGSYLTYLFLAVFAKTKGRFAVYLIASFFCFKFPDYTAFLCGILAADFLTHVKLPLTVNTGGLYVAAGFIIGNFPIVVYLPQVPNSLMYGIGALFISVGCFGTIVFQKALSGSILTYFGKISFPLILTHFFVMQTFSFGLFVYLNRLGIPFYWNLVLMTCASLPLLWGAAEIFYRWIEKPTEYLLSLLFSKTRKNHSKA